MQHRSLGVLRAGWPGCCWSFRRPGRCGRQAGLRQYGSRLQSSRLGSRLLNSYTIKGSRANVFAPIIAALPADASVLGFYADNYPESSLWKPFGARRILHVKRSDSPDAIRQRGIKYCF